MIEKVNPCHPDKVADRIAGAIVDYCYKKNNNPKVAVEVLIGHGKCNIIVETSEDIEFEVADKIVKRIAGNVDTDIIVVPQDIELAKNQSKDIRCGDNGIFKGVPLTENEKKISDMARYIYAKYSSDGKYILTNDKIIVCQSNCNGESLKKDIEVRNPNKEIIVNPLGDWTGGTNVDTGATNRKLGSDMGQSVTGGGLHGKDLSKADVSVNIYAFELAQLTGKEVNICCAIGDKKLDVYLEDKLFATEPYENIVAEASDYINSVGGFEKFAEWGLY